MTSIRSHSLSKAPRVAGALNRYFGIDLARVPQMSNEELAAIADRANQMKRLLEVLPILEAHLQVLLDGQVTYEQFVQRVLKDGEKASRKLDKALVDSFLMERGYLQHQELLKQKLGHDSRKQDVEFKGQIDLNNLDMASWLRLFQLKHQNQQRQIQQKVPEGIQQMRQSEARRLAEQQRRDLLTYGSAGNPKRNGLGNRVSRFFTGG